MELIAFVAWLLGWPWSVSRIMKAQNDVQTNQDDLPDLMLVIIWVVVAILIYIKA